jgi:hypothetical protein
VLALAPLIPRDEGIDAAQAFLARQLQQRPSIRGEAALIDLSLANPNDDPGERLRSLKQITDQLVVRTASYRCQRCGFGTRAHHWHCPSCKSWAASSRCTARSSTDASVGPAASGVAARGHAGQFARDRRVDPAGAASQRARRAGPAPPA